MNHEDTEKIIDIKMLIFFILKRWKRIFACLLAGVLLGSCFAVLKGRKTVEDFNTSKLNMEQIVQYEHYQQLYRQQLATEAASVMQQMNPNEVYFAQQVFFLTMPANWADLIRQKYALLLSDVDVVDGLIEASGFGCNEAAIKELVTVQMTVNEPATLMAQSGFVPATGKFTVNVLAPTQESGDAMLELLYEAIEAMNKEMAERFDGFDAELMAHTYQFGYDEDVQNAQKKAADVLNNYTSTLVKLEKEMSDEDLEYYAEVYGAKHEVDEAKELLAMIKRIIKYAIVFGAFACILAVGIYGVRFLLDDHIKTAHEVHEYGLYTIACLQPSASKITFMDKLFAGGNLPVNSKEYLLNAMKALGCGNMVLSGDIHDQETAETMNWLASQMEDLQVVDRLACDESGLLTAKESDGAILFVRLWKTTAFDLKRELYVLRQIDKPVKGVVVLKG